MTALSDHPFITSKSTFATNPQDSVLILTQNHAEGFATLLVKFHPGKAQIDEAAAHRQVKVQKSTKATFIYGTTCCVSSRPISC
jgi:hypothetical protein